jgi:hypothetical protein
MLPIQSGASAGRLGKPRTTAVCRHCKLAGRLHCPGSQSVSAVRRSRDPYQKVSRGWIVRRLSADSNPIEIADLGKRDDEVLRYAMAQE